ncbi:MAG: hypothetical protein HYR73_08905 [Candidatus Eisenbacteria bacterium]|nr:hypothetical protein [Candidatus Eisenbacteria bacterium]
MLTLRPRLRLSALALLILTTRAAAAPTQFLPVGDPIESELRILDLFSDSATAGRIRLPHLFTRPLTIREIQGGGPGLTSASASVSLARIERVIGRESGAGFVTDSRWPPTPRLLSRGPEGRSFEVSAGIEGRGEADADTATFASASGLHVRTAIAVDHWLMFSHLVVGHFDHARSFADPVVANTDVTTLTEESYLSYAGADDAWGAQIGRNRWHFGPGEEGSLVISRTSAPMTALAFRGRLAGLRLDGIALSATLDAAAGEQLAAHRLEWQPHPRWRLGVTEAARYRASGVQPLYVVGVVPYVIVQRLLVQDSPDSLDALRNNVLFGLDAAWRATDGARFYGEIAVDDLHAKTSENPDKIAWQLGWNGAGMIGRERLSWGGELTRVWRYVYTSSYGREFRAQGLPIGFPTGPDSRRLRVYVNWDPSAAWQWSARAASTDRGEGTLDDAYVPGSARESASHFLGVVERTRETELGARWWPAGGVDVSVNAGYRWIANAGHVSDASSAGAYGSAALRLTR